MLDIGWSELVVIGVVALVVIGPKDLPRALHTAGKLFRKARLMSHDLHNSVDDMLRQADLAELRREAEALHGSGLSRHLENTIDPRGDMKAALQLPAEPLTQPLPAPPPGEAVLPVHVSVTEPLEDTPYSVPPHRKVPE